MTRLRKSQSSMVDAFKSFFSRASSEESKDTSGSKSEYDSFEQVTASKFDIRI